MTEDEVWAPFLKFRKRLSKIGIETEFTSNVPWIYLDKVNGKKVKERYMANHGFTAFFYPINLNQKVEISDRREVFKLIRNMLITN